jgi:hypothetical protein
LYALHLIFASFGVYYGCKVNNFDFILYYRLLLWLVVEKSRKEGIRMSNKQERIQKLIDVMKNKINQLEDGYINDKNLEELIEKMK